MYVLKHNTCGLKKLYEFFFTQFEHSTSRHRLKFRSKIDYIPMLPLFLNVLKQNTYLQQQHYCSLQPQSQRTPCCSPSTCPPSTSDRERQAY